MKKNNKTRKCRQALTRSHKQLSFLPEVDFSPGLPSKKTLAWRALLLMLKGKKISHLDFQGETNSWRLAAYIDILKKMGWPIMSIDIMHNTSGRCVPISLYFLEKEIIEKFKKLSGGAI